MDERLREGVEAARKEAGSFNKIAVALGLSRQTVSAWRRIPAEHVLRVEEVTGVPRHVLRPDVYPEAERTNPQPAEAAAE